MEHVRTWKTEELLQQHRWARSLARHLVADDATADDVAQEAMIIAMDRAPAEARRGGRLRAWLGVVVRNVAKQTGRSEGRRAHREKEAASQELLPSALDATTLAEGQKLLLEALLTLDEESRHMVLLRYQEGLSAADIARRLGKNPGTVRSKIKRALGRLRGELDEVHGGDRNAWHAAVAPLAMGVPVRGVAAGSSFSLWMAAAGLVAATAAFVGLVSVLSTVFLTDNRNEAPGVLLDPLERTLAGGDSSAAPDEERAIIASAPAEPLGRKAAAAVAVSGASAVPKPSETKTGRVRLRLVDQDAQPVAGVEVTARGTEPAISGADGRVEVEVFLGRESDEASLSLRHSGHAADVFTALATRRQTVDAGDHILRPGGDVHGRVVDHQGNPLAAMIVSTSGLERRGSSGGGITVVTSTPLGQTQAITDSKGRFELRGVLAGEIDVDVASKNKIWTGSASSVEVPPGATVRDLLITADEAPLKTRIEGVVLNHLGEPAPYARIHMKWRRFFSKHSESTGADAEGRFAAQVSSNASVDMWFCAAGESQPLASRKGVAAGSINMVVRLEPPRSLTVLVVDVEGSPVPNAEVWIAWDSQSSMMPKVADANGRVELSPPIDEFTLHARADGYAEFSEKYSQLPTDRSDALALPVQLSRIPQLKGLVRTAEGGPFEGATLSVRRVAKQKLKIEGLPSLVEDDVAASGTTTVDGTFTITLRDSGEFMLRAEGEGYAPAEFGPFRFSPKVGRTDVLMTLSEGGTVEGFVFDGDVVRERHVVMLFRGDGVLETVRTDLDGAYRFIHVTPGPCFLRVVTRMHPYGIGASISSMGRPYRRIEGDVVVQEGVVSRFDLVVGKGLPPVMLKGKLVFTGLDPARFRAILVPEEGSQGGAEMNQPQRVASDGTFEVLGYQPGRYTLQLVEQGAKLEAEALHFAAPVDLAAGDNHWILEVAFSRVAVSAGADPAVEKLLWRGPAGAFAVRSLPAVGEACTFPSGTILRVSELKLLTAGALLDLDQVEPLESISAPAGADVTVGQ